MSIWYAICDFLPFEMLHWDFMKNALLAVLLLTPLLGLTSTMVVAGKMSFFSDALGHASFTGIAIGAICGFLYPTWAAIIFSVIFALLFSYIRSKSNHTADTLIGVFSSTAVALGIFVATLGGGSFTKYNKYLIGDILSITKGEIGLLALVLVTAVIFFLTFSNKLTLCMVHPQLANSRGICVGKMQTAFTVMLAVIVTMSISWVGLLILNSLLVLPAAISRNIAKNLRQYYFFALLAALISGIAGLILSYFLGVSAGVAICLILAGLFAISFIFRKVKA